MRSSSGCLILRECKVWLGLDLCWRPGIYFDFHLIRKL